MSEKNEKKKIDRRSSSGAALILSVVVAVTAVVLAVYVMQTDPYNLELLCVLAFVIIIGVFFAVFMGVSNQKARYRELEERLEETERSQKASYILDKKNFKSIEEMLKHIMDSHDEGMSELIMTEKSVGKVVVGKMNKAMDALRADLDGLADKVAASAGQADNTEILRAIENLSKEQQRLESRIAAMSGNMGGAPSVSQNVTVTAPADGSAPIITTSESAPVADMMEVPEDIPASGEPEPLPEDLEMLVGEASEEPTMPEPIPEPGAEPEPETIPEPEPEPIPEPEPEPEPEPIPEPEPEPIPEPEPEPIPEVAPVSDDPNHVMTPEEIAAMVAGANATAEPEPIPEPEPEPEPIPEIAPVSDDPNHVMTPEEIAAMIAGANATAEPEPIPEPEPEPIPEPIPEPAPAEEDEAKMPELDTLPDSVADILGGIEEVEEEPSIAEEKPEMPDLSDPNRALSPDEIAALFANM